LTTSKSPLTEGQFRKPLLPARSPIMPGGELSKTPVSKRTTSSIRFETLQTLNFATEKSRNATICRRAVMPLYANDNEATGPRRIVTLWNNLNEWLSDTEIFGFLCYLASISSRKTVVVDSLLTDPRSQHNAPDISIQNWCYNYEADKEPEVIFMPIFFPGHWAIVIYDKQIGTFFVDPLANTPSRLEPAHPAYHVNRMQLIRQTISRITKRNLNEIELQILNEANFTTQHDGCSCGYFVGLYAEAWIMNDRNLILDPININVEKKRILWHLNELYGRDDVPYQPRQSRITTRSTSSGGTSKEIPRDISIPEIRLNTDEELTEQLSNLILEDSRRMPSSSTYSSKYSFTGEDLLEEAFKKENKQQSAKIASNSTFSIKYSFTAETLPVKTSEKSSASIESVKYKLPVIFESESSDDVFKSSTPIKEEIPKEKGKFYNIQLNKLF